MGEFFKGWRRKAGCVTLVLACVMAVGWVRSQHFSDFIKYRIAPQHWFFIRSNDSRFTLSILKEYQPGRFTFFRIFDSSPIQKDRSDTEYPPGFTFCGVNLGIDDGTTSRAGVGISNPPKSYFCHGPTGPLSSR